MQNADQTVSQTQTWYDRLYPHTPRTVAVQLTGADVAALSYACERSWSRYQKQDQLMEGQLFELQTTLAGLMANDFGENAPCFVKLSTRSPKDAVRPN
jgi:hypothetical protein